MTRGEIIKSVLEERGFDKELIEAIYTTATKGLEATRDQVVPDDKVEAARKLFHSQVERHLELRRLIAKEEKTEDDCIMIACLQAGDNVNTARRAIERASQYVPGFGKKIVEKWEARVEEYNGLRLLAKSVPPIIAHLIRADAIEQIQKFQKKN